MLDYGMQMALLNAYESFACANTMGTNNNCVLMVYDMDAYKFNCQRLFNLLCIYGNVLKVGDKLLKILKSDRRWHVLNISLTLN